MERDDPLVRRFVRQQNDAGEWSMADLDLGYRICAFNTDIHGGVHLHGPGGSIRPVDISSPDEAERIVKVYAWTYPDGFTWERFRRCLTWRSE